LSVLGVNLIILFDKTGKIYIYKSYEPLA